MVEPGVLPAGTPGLVKPNSPAALEWVGRALEPKELGRAPARLGVQVTSGRKAGTASNSGLDGALYLNYAPSGEKMWDNASLNEMHLVNLMTLKAEWEDRVTPET